ncbi:MAG TPA: HlyD family secretion protein [Planctomycetota bacterium]|nr:HlyD family secretion protein [Planctomycetota bacterium]
MAGREDDAREEPREPEAARDERHEESKDGKKSEGSAPPAGMPRRSRRRVVVIVLSLVVVGAAAAIAAWLHYRHYESTDDAFIEGHVTAVSSKVAAHVVKLLVEDNQDLEEGQLIVELDRRDFEARLAQAKAGLEAARSRLASAEAGLVKADADVEAALADVTAAETEADRAAHDLERYQAAGNAVTRQSLDNARALAISTAAQLRAARDKAASARSQVPYAKAQVAVAKAEIGQAEAQFREAELQLSYCEVRAPVAGRVTRRTVEKGAYVQPGEPLLALVERDVWVVANFRETQLRDMRVGQPVQIEIDALPDAKLRGHVDSFMRGTGARFSLIPPENATGNYVKVVQRVPVKIVFDEPLPEGREIGVGVSVVPTVTVK